MRKPIDRSKMGGERPTVRELRARFKGKAYREFFDERDRACFEVVYQHAGSIKRHLYVKLGGRYSLIRIEKRRVAV